MIRELIALCAGWRRDVFQSPPPPDTGNGQGAFRFRSSPAKRAKIAARNRGGR